MPIIALVTGANRGIGLEACRQLAQRGLTVLLGSRDATKGQQAAAPFIQQGLPIQVYQLDVTDSQSIERVQRDVDGQFGQLDILINNAAILYDTWQQAVDADLAVVQQALDTNTFGAWRMCQAFVPLLRKSRHGRIVNVSSEAGSLASMEAGTPAYNISKVALNALTRMLAAELRSDGILVNAVCPGWVAIFSDIHGNPSALNAVLQDIERQGGVDAYWVLGDLCAIGYDPAGVLDRLSALNNAHFIRGNADRYVSTGARPAPSIANVQADNALLPLFAEVMSSFAWTQGHLAGRGWTDWLARLPLEVRLVLPDGTRVLLVHAQPGSDEGNGLNPGMSDAALQAQITDCEADLICIGHFHKAMDRMVGGVRLINPGSVSNPSSGTDLRPTYAILHTDVAGYTVSFYRVDYDYMADIEAVRRCGIAGADFINRALTGQLQVGWMDSWDGVTHTPVFQSAKVPD